MMILVTGGSGSGKSAYAETCIGKLSEGMQKYYIATMQVYGEEGQRKVERHKKLRAGKGFLTIEQTVNVKEVSGKMQEELQSCALLECMSNLVANEMFVETKMHSCDEVVDKVLSDMEILHKNVKHLVVVTNNVFEDGIEYDASTKEYMKALGQINTKLSRMADQVVEVVVGIPVILKNEA